MATAITRLETSGIISTESVSCLESVKHNIKQASGKMGDAVLKKLDHMLEKNLVYKMFTIISV